MYKEKIKKKSAMTAECVSKIIEQLCTEGIDINTYFDVIWNTRAVERALIDIITYFDVIWITRGVESPISNNLIVIDHRNSGDFLRTSYLSKIRSIHIPL